MCVIVLRIVTDTKKRQSSLLGTMSGIWHYDMSIKALDESAELKLTRHVQSSNSWVTYRKAMVILSLLTLLLVTTSCALPIYNSKLYQEASCNHHDFTMFIFKNLKIGKSKTRDEHSE